MRRRILVQGRVQGVGFRASCARRALAMGVGGWVKNRVDGAVEAVFEGDEEQVAELVTWCSAGPPLARVRDVDVTEEQPTGERSFSVR